MAAAHEALDLGKVKYTALYVLIDVSIYECIRLCVWRVCVIDHCVRWRC